MAAVIKNVSFKLAFVFNPNSSKTRSNIKLEILIVINDCIVLTIKSCILSTKNNFWLSNSLSILLTLVGRFFELETAIPNPDVQEVQ